MAAAPAAPCWKPVLRLDPAIAGPALAALHEGLSEIDSNIRFVLQELPKLALKAEFAAHVRKVFEDFAGCSHDVRPEILNLRDKLGHGDPNHPNDPGIANPDPRVTIGFIRDWLQAEFNDLHALVQALGAPAARREVGSAYILVAESAFNMLTAYGRMQDALDRVRAAVEPLLGPRPPD